MQALSQRSNAEARARMAHSLSGTKMKTTEEVSRPNVGGSCWQTSRVKNFGQAIQKRGFFGADIHEPKAQIPVTRGRLRKLW